MRVQKRAAILLFVILMMVLAPLAWQRHQVDKGSPDVALFVDGNELLLRSSQRGVPLDAYLAAMDEVGVPAVVVPVTTLSALEQRGVISILTGKDALAFLPAGEELRDTFESVIIGYHPDSMPLVLQALETAQSNYRVVPETDAVLVQASRTSIMSNSIGFDPFLIDAVNRSGMDLILAFWPFTGSSIDFVVEQITEINPVGVVFMGPRIADLPGNFAPLADVIRARDIPIFRIQDQITLRGYAHTEGVTDVIGDHTEVIRAARFSRAETNIGGFTPETLTEKWISYVREYNVRGLYISPLFTDDDIGANQGYLRAIIEGLSSNDYRVSSVASAYPRWHPSPLWQGLLGLAVSLFMLVFLPYRRVALFLVYLVAVLTLFVLNMTPLRAATNVFWSLGMATLASFVFLSAFRLARRPLVGYSLIILLTTVAALGIALMMSDYNALMEYTYFRGVKLQYLLPLLMMAMVLWRDQLNPNGLHRLLSMRLSVPQILLATVLMSFLGLYLLRSGNVDTISGIESQTRLLMDSVLQVRPRFKELAGNALILFALLYRTRLNSQVRNLILLCGTVAPISVVNSFMHFRTPVALSLLRVLHAAWMGAVLGACLFVLARIAESAEPRILRIWSVVSKRASALR